MDYCSDRCAPSICGAKSDLATISFSRYANCDGSDMRLSSLSMNEALSSHAWFPEVPVFLFILTLLEATKLSFGQILADLVDYALPISALIVGALLFLLAPVTLRSGRTGRDASLQVLVLRTAIVGFIALQIADIAMHQTLAPYYNRLLLKASLSLFSIILAFLVFNMLTHVLDAKFGNSRTFDGKTLSVPSYHSRMAGMLLLAVLVLILMYSFIEIWGMDSLLQQTGFIGIVAAFLVLTSAIWMPDLFYGLVLLNSSMAEEGDTIAIPSEDRIYIINRLTPFYTLLLDVDNNHRTMMRNSQMIRDKVENLSKRASVEGLRRKMEFKIGYPKESAEGNSHASLFSRIDEAITAAFARVCEDPVIQINPKIPFEWSLVEAGDNALRFILYYHLASLPDTKLTSKIRTHIRGSGNAIVRLVFEEASARGLDLSTPSLLKIDGGNLALVADPKRSFADT